MDLVGHFAMSGCPFGRTFKKCRAMSAGASFIGKRPDISQCPPMSTAGQTWTPPYRGVRMSGGLSLEGRPGIEKGLSHPRDPSEFPDDPLAACAPRRACPPYTALDLNARFDSYHIRQNERRNAL